MSEIRLEDDDVSQLQECLQLTPKLPTLFTMKLVGNLIIEIDNQLAK